MRRKVLISVSVVVLILVLSLGLVACDKNKTKKDDPKSNISRMTTAYYVGEDENFAVMIEKGKREKSFIADGKVNDVVEFVDIAVMPLTQNDYEEIDFEVMAEGNALNGKLKKTNNGEFKATIDMNFSPEKIKLKAMCKDGEEDDNVVAEIELGNVLDDKLTAEDIVNIAKNEFKDRIANEGKDMQREIYVKLISGDRINYYYYVSFIGNDVDYWALLIDPKTGDIASKK